MGQSKILNTDTSNSNPSDTAQLSLQNCHLAKKEKPIGFSLTGAQRSKDPHINPHCCESQHRSYGLSVGLPSGWLLNRK